MLATTTHSRRRLLGVMKRASSSGSYTAQRPQMRRPMPSKPQPLQLSAASSNGGFAGTSFPPRPIQIHAGSSGFPAPRGPPGPVYGQSHAPRGPPGGMYGQRPMGSAPRGMPFPIMQGGARPWPAPFGQPRPPLQARPPAAAAAPPRRPFDEDDPSFDEALMAVIEPAPSKRPRPVEPPSTISSVPPGQQQAVAVSNVPSHHSFPAAASESIASRSVGVDAPTDAAATPASSQLGETLQLKRELERLRSMLHERDNRIGALNRRLQQTEVQVSDLHAAHTAVQEEARAEIKRVQSEASKDVSNLQSLLSFKSQELMEADHRKRMLEAKLEQFRKRVEQFQSMAPDIPGEFGAHGGPQGSQPAKAVASSPKPATASPKPPVRPPQPPIPPQPSQRSVGNRRSPSQSGRHLGTIQAPASQATPPDDALCTPPVLGPTAPPPAQAAVVPDVTSHAPQHALITSPAQQGTSSCGSRSIDTRSSSSSASVHAHPGLHVLDTLFVHGSPDLKMLMQYDSARCWFSASGYMDGCARCTSGAGHVHSPTTLLADCLHSLITVAGTSSATDSTSTSAAACMTSLFSCLVSLCGIRTAAPALAEAASADSSAPPLVVGPVCAFDAVCTVCDPVRAASLHLMQLLVYACPTLLQSERRRQWSPSRARPAEPGTSHQTASPDASLPMFKGAVRMGAGITDTHPSQTVLSGAMQRLSLRVTSRLASTSALAAPTRASAHTSVNIVSVAVNGILQASTSLGTRGDPSVARTTLVSRMSTRCTSLLQLLQASIVLSGTSDCITPLIPLLSSRAVAVIIASCGFYLRDWLAAWSAAASDDMRTSLAATLPDVCMLAVAALQFLSEVVISVPPSRFESIASHITDALKWACGLLVDMPPLHSVSADLLLSPALQHFVQVHVEVNRLIGCIISCQERAGVTCILTLSTGAAVSLTQDATQEDDVTPATAAADDGTPAAPRAGCDCDAGALHTCGLKVTANAFSCPLPALIHACHLIARTASELLLAPHKLQDAGTLVLASMKRCVRSTLAVIATSCAALSALGTPSPRPLASPGLLGRACVQAALAGLLFRLSKAAVLAEWCADANSVLYISHLERVLLDFAPDALALSKR